LMEDLGYYVANYDATDNMTFANGAGCGFHTAKCNTDQGGRGTQWCFDENTATTTCTPDFKGVGYCNVLQYTSALPSHFQYFADPTVGGPMFTDHCPYIQAYQNRVCNEVRATSAAEFAFGFYFGVGGRCWTSRNLVREGYSSTLAGTHRCLESQCVAGVPMFRTDNVSAWVACTAPSQWVTAPGFLGSVQCPPDAVAFCSTLPYIAFTDAPPPTALVQQESSPSLLVSLIFSGQNWSNIVGNDTGREVALQNAVRQDVAERLDLLIEDVVIRGMRVGSLILDLGLVTFTWTTVGVERELNKEVRAGSTSWMNRTLRVYSSFADDSTRLVFVDAFVNTAFCSDPLNAAEDYCIMVIVVVAIALIIALVVTLCLYKYCCKKVCPCCRGEDAEPTDESHDPHATDENRRHHHHHHPRRRGSHGRAHEDGEARPNIPPATVAVDVAPPEPFGTTLTPHATPEEYRRRVEAV